MQGAGRRAKKKRRKIQHAASCAIANALSYAVGGAVRGALSGVVSGAMNGVVNGPASGVYSYPLFCCQFRRSAGLSSETDCPLVL